MKITVTTRHEAGNKVSEKTATAEIEDRITAEYQEQEAEMITRALLAGLNPDTFESTGPRSIHASTPAATPESILASNAELAKEANKIGRDDSILTPAVIVGIIDGNEIIDGRICAECQIPISLGRPANLIIWLKEPTTEAREIVEGRGETFPQPLIVNAY